LGDVADDGRFANGKPIALVVDVGASMISVTPVYDGMVLRKGMSLSDLGLSNDEQESRLRRLAATSSPTKFG
jgi:actin-related protein 4